MAGIAPHVAAIRLGRPLPDASRNQPGRLVRKRLDPRGSASPLFGLAPGGVCRAVPVAGSAVGSYPTFSPLLRWNRPKVVSVSRPDIGCFRCPHRSGSFSVALSLRSPSPVVDRHRLSVEPGLSSPGRSPERPPGRLAGDVMGRMARRVKGQGGGARVIVVRGSRGTGRVRPLSSSPSWRGRDREGGARGFLEL